MEKLKNTQGISMIIMHPVAYTKCQIGQDWYKNEFEISFAPGDIYPDYMEVKDWIMENIDGKELNIEDVVDKIYSFIQDEYAPKDLEVTDDIKGCKTHFDVTVIKQ